MDARLDDVQRVLHCLDRQAVKRCLKRVCPHGVPADAPVPVADQLRLYLVDWLAHLGVFSDAQQYDIVCQLDGPDGVEQWARAFEMCEQESEKPTITVAIADYRWVSYGSGRKGFFDVQESEYVECLPHPAVTHILCDVTALWTRSRYRLAKILKCKDATHADGQGGSSDAAATRQPTGFP